MEQLFMTTLVGAASGLFVATIGYKKSGKGFDWKKYLWTVGPAGMFGAGLGYGFAFESLMNLFIAAGLGSPAFAELEKKTKDMFVMLKPQK